MGIAMRIVGISRPFACCNRIGPFDGVNATVIIIRVCVGVRGVELWKCHVLHEMGIRCGALVEPAAAAGLWL